MTMIKRSSPTMILLILLLGYSVDPIIIVSLRHKA